MGFVRQKKIFKLVFADPEMEGLEVRIRSMSIGKALDMEDLLGAGRSLRDKTEELLQLLTGALVSWNLEEEVDDETDPDAPTVARPVPATLDGLRSQDIDLVVVIANAWLDAIIGVSRPLGRPSPSGGQSLEASIPMDTPSESQPSLPVPS